MAFCVMRCAHDSIADTLRYIMVRCLGGLIVDDGPFRFHLPATSMNVQHLLEDDQDASDNEYEGVSCPACAMVHFVNRKTGKLLGQDK